MVLSIDATGSIIIPPKMSEISSVTDKLKHVFFYNVLAKTNKNSVPVKQMISQKHTAEFMDIG